jgi:hypothetical protein
MHRFEPVIQPTPRTRSSYRPWYNYDQAIMSSLLPLDSLVPATINHNDVIIGSLFQVNYSTNHPDRINTTTMPKMDQSGHNYYSNLILSPISDQNLSDISDMAVKNRLTVTCSGNYESNQASSHWSFDSHKEIYSGKSPTIPNCSRYRSELISVMVALHILHKLGTSFPPAHGIITITCGHKGAFRDAFSNAPVGVCTAVQHDYDILLEIRRLRAIVGFELRPVQCSGPSEPVKLQKVFSSQEADINWSFIIDPSANNRNLVQQTQPPSMVITVI